MIINTLDIKHIYLATNYVDMRKLIDGLALIVSTEFDLDSSLFIFTNRARNRIKLLYYDFNGFWLFFKRLEQGKFKMHDISKSSTRIIDKRQLRWLLERLKIDQKFAHKSIENRLII